MTNQMSMIDDAICYLFDLLRDCNEIDQRSTRIAEHITRDVNWPDRNLEFLKGMRQVLKWNGFSAVLPFSKKIIEEACLRLLNVETDVNWSQEGF